MNEGPPTMAAVKIIHLLCLLLVGYTLVTLEVYWILEEAHEKGGSSSGAGNNSGQISRISKTAAVASPAAAAAANDGSSNKKDVIAEAKISSNAKDIDKQPHGHLKGAKEQDLVKQLSNIQPVKPVTPKILVDQPVTSASANTNGASFVKQSIRFPQYGTREFTQLCPYTAKTALPPPAKPNCTMVLHPRHDSNEGLAAWASMIVQGHLLTRQNGCGIKFDYGPGVDVASLVTPYRNLDDTWEDQTNNWAIPPDFKCEAHLSCSEYETQTVSLKKLSNPFRKNVQETPNYRYAYVGLDSRFNESLYDPLKDRLPGFDVKLGAACSLGMLFHPSHDIVKYEPTFFTELLPALRDASTLVVALYIRSGFADVATAAEKKGETAAEKMKGKAQRATDESVECAAALEEGMLRQEIGGKYGRVVWLVVSDSSLVKDYVADIYGGKHVSAQSRSIPRDVLHTTVKGMHTRPKRGPSTIDFAAAFLDWYLLGESDVIVTTGSIFSFGAMAATRTARPLYSAVPVDYKKKQMETGECQGLACHCRNTYDASDAMSILMATATG